VRAYGRKYYYSLLIKFDYLRPKRLSGDKSNVIDAVFHALDWLEKKNLKFDAVMMLQPTSPIRIDKEIKKIQQSN